MNASKLFAAVAIFAVAGSTFAADLPAANAAVTAAASTAATSITATALNVPAVTITVSANRTRAEVKAEAVEFVKNHKTALAILLDHAKN